MIIEKGLRGGISYIAKRYTKANNKYMKNYDPTKPSMFIPYPDMNNLHGCRVNGYLPYGGIKMKIYIDFNTEKRKNAANSFEKGFFKLMINSVYAKTMENLQKRINVTLVNNEKDYLKYTSRPTHITHKNIW